MTLNQELRWNYRTNAEHHKGLLQPKNTEWLWRHKCHTTVVVTLVVRKTNSWHLCYVQPRWNIHSLVRICWWEVWSTWLHVSRCKIRQRHRRHWRLTRRDHRKLSWRTRTIYRTTDNRGHLHLSNWPTKKLDKTAQCTPWPFADAHTLQCVVTGWASGLLKAPDRDRQAIGHLLTENNKMSATSTSTSFRSKDKKEQQSKKTMTTPAIVHFTCTCHRTTWASCMGWENYREWRRELITCKKTWLGIFL